jgi:methionyl-tRNA formyltransferase
MQMDAGLDTGAMLLRRALPIGAQDTSQTLHDKLAVLGGACILEALEKLPKNELTALPQTDALATYAAKITKEEAHIDWRQPADVIARAVRAYNPVPGAFTQREGETLKLWSAQAGGGQGVPGTVLTADRDGIVVACGAGALRIEALQRAGGKRLPAAQFLAGVKLDPGERWA